jgi:hypothetical protein
MTMQRKLMFRHRCLADLEGWHDKSLGCPEQS